MLRYIAVWAQHAVTSECLWRSEIPEDVGIRTPDTKIGKKDDYHDTEEICQARGSCGNICGYPVCGNVEQLPARKSYGQ